MNEITQILKRLMDSCGYKTEGAVAKAIGETVASFSNKKKTGTIKNKLLLHGVEKGIRLEWLRTGQGEISQAQPASEELILLRKYVTCLEEEIKRLKEPWSGEERRVAKLPPRRDVK